MRNFLIGGVMGGAGTQIWWGMKRGDEGSRLAPFILIFVLAVILLLPAGCASPPLDVRPPIARVS